VQPASPLRPAEQSPVIAIGSRRELFVDDFLIARLVGGAKQRLHHPTPREVVMVWDQPWEGNTSGYPNVFKDGELYRMYYRAWACSIAPGKLSQAHSAMLCYAESRDGIHWTRPEMGLVGYPGPKGSKKNNIVFAGGKVGNLSVVVSTFTEFKDDNPACAADARYKGLVLAIQPRGLLAFKSADGLRWTPMSDKQVITGDAFDSPNLAFWDRERGEYRAYWRYVTSGESGNGGVRGVKTATSKDFLHWSAGVKLKYPGAPTEQLYTNQIKPYHRAPHLFFGFPVRYLDRGWSDSMRALPDPKHRELRASALPRAGTALTETVLMTSRDGRAFHRWQEAFMRPGIERSGTWNYGQQYTTWHPVETPSSLEGAPNELSLYATEDYWTGKGTKLRRYTLRLDGFISVSAPMNGGELITKPLTLKGSKLTLNFATSAAGDIRVEIQDADGKPLPGFTLDDCPPIFGDAIERTVTWKNGGDVSALAGKPVRLRFVLKDADLYAFQFTASSKSGEGLQPRS